MSQESTQRFDGAALAEDSADGAILRMFLHGAGYSEALVDRRPVIGIANSWSELNPCNAGLRDLAEAVKRGVIAAGGFPLEFPTISISEPFVRPTSMLLRNLMSMDVEEMITSAPIDGVVLLGGCDKTVPAQLMGALSADVPAISLAAGPRATARWGLRTLTIDDLWELADDRRRGALSEEAWRTVQLTMNGSVGTCNVMGTAATMAVVAEVIGMALPGTALLPATSAARKQAAELTGARAVELAKTRTEPTSVVTKAALENALRVVMAIGGSTNAIIHLEALAGRIGERIGIDRIAEISDETPLLADVRPTGTYLLEDLDAVGGVPAVMRELDSLLDLAQLAGDGRAWAQALPGSGSGDGALRTMLSPKEKAGGLAVVRGTLAPDGAIIKRSGSSEKLRKHRGPALVFDGVEDLHERIDDEFSAVTPETVLVLRGVGPVGGPGMPEVGAIPIPKRLLNAGVKDMVRISDARMSGTAAGTVVLHVTPEAAVGGPLALVEDGDEIQLDVDSGVLDLLVTDDVLAERRLSRGERADPSRGFERLHARHVLQADEGCDFDFLRVGTANG